MQLEPLVRPANAAWLVRLRWASLAGQVSAVYVAMRVLGLVLPVAAVFAVLAAQVAFNFGAAAWVHLRPTQTGELHLGVQLLADVTGLTAMLYLTGGPENPFNFLYLVHVALACVVAPPRVAWAVAGASSLAFGALFFSYVPLELVPADGVGETPLGPGPAAPTVEHAHGAHAVGTHGGHGDELMALHLRGMWVAFVVASGFIVYFVTRIQRTLAIQSAALAESEARTQRVERLASLGTLAAGAAHELATPLASIAVAARELELAAEEACAEDIAVIQTAVGRCRTVLSRMSAQAGATQGESPSRQSVASLIDEALDGLGEVSTTVADIEVVTPAGPVITAVRPLVDNALSAARERVELVADVAGGVLTVTVTDDGPPVDGELLARVGEPFFTTKAPGEGVGLGVFLSRSIAEQLGGGLEVTSVPGEGTVATLRIPVARVL